MNRLAREIAKQGNGGCFAFKGKLYRPARGGFSEVRVIEGSRCMSFFPGLYGQPNLGFRSLEEAGALRRRAAAMPKYRDFERRSFKRMAREAIKFSVFRRADLEAQASYAEAAE